MAFRVVRQRREARRVAKLEEIFQVKDMKKCLVNFLWKSSTIRKFGLIRCKQGWRVDGNLNC